jgi:aladin
MFSHVFQANTTENPIPFQQLQSLLNQNSRSLLQNFPPIPLDKAYYGCYESNAQFQYSFAPEFERSLLNKHDLPIYDHLTDLTNEINNNLQSSNGNNHQLMSNSKNGEIQQPFFKRLLNIYLDNNGLVGLLEDLQSQSRLFKSPQVTRAIVKCSKFLIKVIDAIHAPINPWLMPAHKLDYDLACVKGGKQWTSSLIRAMQWHPHSDKFAVAFKNDIVKIYSRGSQPVVLKHPKQVNVTCLAWKPFYSSLIAIGCAECIIIWDTDALPVSIKPSSSCSFVLEKRYHTDIISLAWHPKTECLFSIATKDNQIMIWDIVFKGCVPIKRIGTGFGLAKFSPNGSHLFTADLSTSFRIWHTFDNTTSEKWTQLVTRCSAACW